MTRQSWPRAWVQANAGAIAKIGYGVVFDRYRVTFTRAGFRYTCTDPSMVQSFLYDLGGMRTEWEMQNGIYVTPGTVRPPAAPPAPPKPKPAPPAVLDPYYTDYEA